MNSVDFLYHSNVKTPCFVIKTEELKENIRGFKTALDAYFERNILSYSVKTNALPYIVNLARKEGCYAEVVSADEYLLAKKLGYPIANIVYNGPMKDRETFIEAVAGGAVVNIENFREIEWLDALAPGADYQLGVRVNVNLKTLGIDDAKSSSRFGFSYENGEFCKAVRKIQEKGFAVSGLHVHRTSTSRGLDVYEALCRYVNRILQEQNLSIRYVDIGGGFFGNMPGKPDYRTYAEHIFRALENKNIRLIVEPGNALIASAVDYVGAVLDCKKIDDAIIISSDASRLHIDPFFHKSNYWYERINTAKDRPVLTEKQVLSGATCLENDIIMELRDTDAFLPGDRIVFKCVGAYTMTLTPNFINLLPAVYALTESGFHCVREKWSVDEWVQKNEVSCKPRNQAILFTNVGRRGRLMTDFRESIGADTKIIAADNWSVAPALFKADHYYLTPKIWEENYIDSLLDICKKENVKALTSLIDPEIEIIARNREKFVQAGIIPLCPSAHSADLCFDKYKMFEYLTEKGINTVLTFASLETFRKAWQEGEIAFPVFIKPRTGSGSVGAVRINNMQDLEAKFRENAFEYIIQEFMDCEDCDADVYVDAISHKTIAAFSKRKIETRIGGASKTISFRDQKLFDFIDEIVDQFEFSGALDMDFFYKDGTYYLSEINPRFGGAYLHAYGAGVDFPKMIRNNIQGIVNEPQIGQYRENIIMLMYDDVVITDVDSLKGDYRNAK